MGVQLLTNTLSLRFTKITTVSESTHSCKYPIMELKVKPTYLPTLEISSSSSRSRRWVEPRTASWPLRGRTLKTMSQSNPVAFVISNRINHQWHRKVVRDLPPTSVVAICHQGLPPRSHLLPLGWGHHPKPLFLVNPQAAHLIEWCWPLSTKRIRDWWLHVPLTLPQPVPEPARHCTITTKTKANLTWSRNPIIKLRTQQLDHS